MSAFVVKPAVAAVLPRPDPTITVRRISFVANAPAGAIVRREFRHPRRMFAIEDAAEIPGTKSGESIESFSVVLDSSGPIGGSLSQGMAWMAQADHAQAEPPITLQRKSGATIEWRADRVIIRGSDDDSDELLTALIDFGFFESELRTLEKIVESREPQAQEDVYRAHRISHRDRAHWTRIGETIEALTQARLSFVKLEPMFAIPSKTLSAVGRRLMKQLSARANASARLAALSGRLEALEDLYEGANDRIADYRGWLKGHVMETIIILLLLLEIVVMSIDLSIR